MENLVWEFEIDGETVQTTGNSQFLALKNAFKTYGKFSVKIKNSVRLLPPEKVGIDIILSKGDANGKD